MPEGWDRAGAAAPEADAVAEAAMLLERLAAVQGLPEPLVEATRAGTVQLSWETAARDWYFEIEVPGDGTAELFFQNLSAKQEREWEVDLGGTLSEAASEARSLASDLRKLKKRNRAVTGALAGLKRLGSLVA